MVSSESTVKARVNIEAVPWSTFDRFGSCCCEGDTTAGDSAPRSRNIRLQDEEDIHSVCRGSSFLFRLRRIIAVVEDVIARCLISLPLDLTKDEF